MGWATLFPGYSEPVTFCGFLIRAKLTNSNVYPEFLIYYFRSLEIRNLIIAKSSTGTITNISQDKLQTIAIPLPPLPEQKRIAAILNEQLEAVEKARQATEARLEAARKLPAAYLRQVFESDEAKTWEKKRLGDVARLERGKFTLRPRNNPRYYGGQYPWIQTGEVEAAQKYIKTYRNTLNNDGLSVSKLFSKGTLVITIAATIGAVGILDFDSCMPDSLAGITSDQNISDTEFLYYSLLYIRNHLKSIAPQVAQANLKLELLKPLAIQLPSFIKQKQIASTLNEQIKQVEHLKQTLQEQLNAINKLPAVLLRRVFRGEL